MSRKPYTHPPDAVYQLGKKKERATKCIKKFKEVLAETSHPYIKANGLGMLAALIEHRENLDKI